MAVLLVMSHGNNLMLPFSEVEELQPSDAGTGQDCNGEFLWYPYDDEDTCPRYGEQVGLEEGTDDESVGDSPEGMMDHSRH